MNHCGDYPTQHTARAPNLPVPAPGVPIYKVTASFALSGSPDDYDAAARAADLHNRVPRAVLEQFHLCGFLRIGTPPSKRLKQAQHSALGRARSEWCLPR